MLLGLAAALNLYSCKKDVSSGNTSGSSDSVSVTADDQSQVSDESEAIDDDVNTVLNGQSDFSGDNSQSLSEAGGVAVNSVETNGAGAGKFVIAGLICDGTVTYDTANGQRIITIVYDNSSSCNGKRVRTGTVVITMPYDKKWKNAGTAVTVDIQQLKITRLRDNKSIIIDGQRIFTNVSGGLLKDLATLGSITHTVASDNMSVTFNNGKQRTWHIAKQRLYTYNNGIVLTTTGTYSDGTDTQIAEWGTNRFGVDFKSIISEPKIFRQDCDFRLTAGQNTVKTVAGTTQITYGLDQNGNPTGCPGNGNYYMKIVWNGANGGIYTIILPY